MFERLKFGILVLIHFFSIIGFCQSNEGNAFWCTFMPHVDALINQKVIMITSKYDTKGEIKASGVGLSKKFVVNANKVTLVKVSELIELVDAEKITNQGIQVTTELPSSVYIHQFSDFRSEASIVLPENVLGNSYYTMAYFGRYSRNQVYPSQFAIIGTQNNTSVNIEPSCNTKTGFLKGQNISITLNKGDTYMVQASTENEDITGSYIFSSKAIAIFAGNPWTGVPQGCSNWDNLLEQMVPINAWGKKFVSAPSIYTSYDLYRILASEDNTVITIDGNSIQLDKGKFYEYQSAKASFIKANKPIMVAQYLIGGKCNGHSTGDPSMLILNSIEQNRDTVILYNSSLQSITENYINLIVQTDDIDSTTIDGVPINNIALANNVVDGSPYSFFTLKVEEGSHLIINKGCGVIATAYGYGFAESYAYGGGANFRPINAAPIIDGACVNDIVVFDAGLDSAKVTLKWEFGDGGISTLFKPTHVYKKLGTYTVTLIIENLCLNSTDTISKDIDITMRRNIVGPADTLVCEKDSFTLIAYDANKDASYVWSYPDGTEVNEQAIKILNARQKDEGVYMVKGVVSGCETLPFSTALKISSLPEISLGQDTSYCSDDAPFTISIGQYAAIQWSDGSTGNMYSVDKPQSLSVTVTNENGCRNEDQKTIREFCPTKFYLPNVFSPNEDNLNDFFEPKGINISNYTLEIYDRWGNLIYSGQKWDGTFNGSKVINGVYVYKATYEEAVIEGTYKEKVLIGNILVVK